MQEQGVRPDDPEFLNAHNLLTAIQRQQAFAKQQRMAQQQAQQQRQPQQMNGSTTDAVATNGAHGKFYQILFSPFHSPLSTQHYPPPPLNSIFRTDLCRK
jgi:hypothetical protein